MKKIYDYNRVLIGYLKDDIVYDKHKNITGFISGPFLLDRCYNPVACRADCIVQAVFPLNSIYSLTYGRYLNGLNDDPPMESMADPADWIIPEISIGAGTIAAAAIMAG